jgi:Plasmid pRiA4b ORF-3-like protein
MGTLSGLGREAGGNAMNDLEAAAGHAVLTGQIRSFTAWVGSGRKLTQTGRIGLADARHLVELLGTGDTIDPKIGERVFKTKSSEELSHLTRIVEWAKAARLARVSGTRLVPVKKNASLLDRPLDLVMAMLKAYPKLGRSLFPRGPYRQSLVGDEFTDVSEVLVTTMLAHAGPCPLSLLRASASDMIAERYVLGGLTETQLDFLRGTIKSDVRIAVAALAALGIATIDEAEDTAELTALGRYAIGRVRGMPLPGEPVLHVRITLLDVADPPVWRRVLVPAAYSLDRVHRVIQAAMGWQNYHMHAFWVGELSYGPDPEGVLGHLEEAKVRLADVAEVGGRIGYEYDFGDGWEHELLVEARTEARADRIYPACTGGEGACPPEDTGGYPGYQQLKEILADPSNEEYEEMRTWADSQVGGEFDPARFDVTQANARVSTA